MDIKLAGIDTIAPYENNSRTHTSKQVNALKKDIEKLGFKGAIIICNGVIASGHARLEAVKAIYEGGGKLYPPPGKKRGAKPYPAGTIPVQDASGWTEQEFKYAVIADNRLAEMAAWNRIMLAEEIPTIDEPDLLEMIVETEIPNILTGFSGGGRLSFTGGNYFSEEAPGVSTQSTDFDSDSNVNKNDSGSGGMYPVTFVCNSDEWQEWLRFKTAFPNVSQKQAFLKGIEL